MAKILIVDKSLDEAASLQHRLERRGHEVTTAAGAAEALEADAAETPDLVVLEIGAPCEGGLELMEELIARHPGVPIVLNTAYSAYRDDFRSWAATAEIAKGLDPGALLRKIDAVLGASTASAA